jgi:branched-chain amino acid transport system substrate-binding protein
MKQSQGSNKIKIGAIYPLSGSLAPVGREIKRALSLALDIVNNEFHLPLPLANTIGLPRLGNRKIELVFADTKGDPAQGRFEADRLIEQEGVVALIGAYQSNVTEVASLISEAKNIPFLNPDSSAPSLTKRNFEWFFRTGPDDQLFTDLFFELFRSLQRRGENLFQFGILSEDSEFGLEASAIEVRSIRRFGAEITDIEIYGQPIPSLSPLIQRIRSTNPQVVFGQQFLSDAIQAVQALKAIGWFPDGWVVQNAGYVVPEFLQSVGEDGNYIISRAAWALGLGQLKPLVTKVNQIYRSRYRADMNETNARSFTGFFVFADAINRAGSTDPYAIRAALKQTSIPGERLIMPWKGVRFNQQGQNVLADGLLVQILDREYKIIWPPNLAETGVIWPAPSWNDRGKPI